MDRPYDVPLRDKLRNLPLSSLVPLNHYAYYDIIGATTYLNDILLTLAAPVAGYALYVKTIQIFCNALDGYLTTFDPSTPTVATAGISLDKVRDEYAMSLLLSPITILTGAGTVASPYRYTVQKGLESFKWFEVKINDGQFITEFPFEWLLDENETLCLLVDNAWSGAAPAYNFRLNTRVMGTLVTKSALKAK